MKSIAIIGYGFVGNATEYLFDSFYPGTEIQIHDPDKGHEIEDWNGIQYAFICVPTNLKGNKLETSIIDKVLKGLSERSCAGEIVPVIRSTIGPDQALEYAKNYGAIMMPEFLREKHWKQDVIDTNIPILIGCNYCEDFIDFMESGNLKDKRIAYIDFNNKNISDLLTSFANKKNTTSISNRNFNKLLTSIENCKYLSILWATSEFNGYKECDEIIYNISAYVVSLNKTMRAACLSLAGNDGDVSFSQTPGWMSGFPSRIKFTGNFFEYDKDSHNASLLINSGNSDLVIYLNSLSEKKLILNKKNKNIVIGRPFTKYNIEPDVFIPCGIPGVDFKGHIFRTDNVVSLPLSSLRLSHSKSVQQVLREIIK